MNLTSLADSQVKIAGNESMDMIIYCTFRPKSTACLASLHLKVLLLYEVPLAIRLCIRAVHFSPQNKHDYARFAHLITSMTKIFLFAL
jgi:ATP adenylyltransferase/5',5'''-P-1,P-4-tetraphosphate phosphorylase II